MYPFSFIIFLLYSSAAWYQSIDPRIPRTNDAFESRINESRIVLTGEVHYNSSSPVNKYNFITYLNKYHNFTEYLIEFGYAEGFLLTKYLETGDTTFIIFNTLYPSKDYQAMWNKLYQYNQLQAEEKRITVTGIDFERQRPAIHAIEILLRDLKIEQEFEKQIAVLQKLKANKKIWNPQEETIKVFNEIRTELEGANFVSLKSNINFRHLLNILDNSASHLRMTDRNKDFVKNLSKVYDSEKKYFGQFGGVHIRWEKKYTFSNQLIIEFQDLKRDNVEVIPTRYYNALNTTSNGESEITGGGINFKINGKETVFETEFGNKIENGIYLLDVEKMPEKLSKKIPKGYNYMLYVKGTRALKW